MPFPYLLRHPITSCASRKQAAARIIFSKRQASIEAMLFPNAFCRGGILQYKKSSVFSKQWRGALSKTLKSYVFLF
jgi:hypothetical protein